MALLGNIIRNSQNPITWYAYNNCYERSMYGGVNTSNHLLKFFTVDQHNGVPSGYAFPYTWSPAVKGGGLGTIVFGNSSVEKAILAKGLSFSALVSGTSSVDTAILQMVVSFSALVSGEGSVAKADLAGIISMAATVYGTSEVNRAALGAIANLQATVNGQGSVAHADMFGTCSLSAHVYVNESAATVEQIVDAIWDELTSDHTAVGSMGKALLDAGSAGNPWGSLTSANNDPDTFGELVQQTQQKITPLPGMIFGA